jgi:hypothetical protein
LPAVPLFGFHQHFWIDLFISRKWLFWLKERFSRISRKFGVYFPLDSRAFIKKINWNVVKGLVQREGSLIKPRQSQNRISGFGTESVFCDWHGLINQRILPLNQGLHDVSIYLLKAWNPWLYTFRIFTKISCGPHFRFDQNIPIQFLSLQSNCFD